MRAIAIDHADDDRVARRIAEQRNAVATLRSGTLRTLQQYSDRISPDEKASVEQALQMLDDVLRAPTADLADLQDAEEALAIAVGRFSERIYGDVIEAEITE